MTQSTTASLSCCVQISKTNLTIDTDILDERDLEIFDIKMGFPTDIIYCNDPEDLLESV